MKNFSLPRTKTVTGYTWIQTGITSYTGNARVQTGWTAECRWELSFISTTRTPSGYRKLQQVVTVPCTRLQALATRTVGEARNYPHFGPGKSEVAHNALAALAILLLAAIIEASPA